MKKRQKNDTEHTGGVLRYLSTNLPKYLLSRYPCAYSDRSSLLVLRRRLPLQLGCPNEYDRQTVFFEYESISVSIHFHAISSLC